MVASHVPVSWLPWRGSPWGRAGASHVSSHRSLRKTLRGTWDVRLATSPTRPKGDLGLTYTPQGLRDSVLVLHQGKPNMGVAAGPETNSGADGHLGPVEKAMVNSIDPCST